MASEFDYCFETFRTHQTPPKRAKHCNNFHGFATPNRFCIPKLYFTSRVIGRLSKASKHSTNVLPKPYPNHPKPIQQSPRFTSTFSSLLSGGVGRFDSTVFGDNRSVQDRFPRSCERLCLRAAEVHEHVGAVLRCVGLHGTGAVRPHVPGVPVEEGAAPSPREEP